MAVSSYKAKQMIVMRRDLKMRKGKIAAKVCVYVDGEDALLELAEKGREQGFACALVHDAGLTEFHGEPTYTCLAFEPLRADQIDPITGELPLY